MFHVELRRFPHSACAFNLTDTELAQILEPWAREQWIELGERKWSPHQARLSVLEGPRLPVEDLALGRGWRNAQQRCTEVTERVLAQARASLSAPSAAPASAPAPGETAAQSEAAGATGSLDTRVQPLLGPDPAALLQAWRLAARRRPELSPSESLALAESTLRALDDPPL